MISIEKMPDDSRVWVYQSNRPLEETEEKEVLEKISVFLSGWAAHGEELKAGASIFYHRYVIIAADEAQVTASGCSIDKLVHFLKDLGVSMNVDFFNRLLTGYFENDHLTQVPLHQFWAL